MILPPLYPWSEPWTTDRCACHYDRGGWLGKIPGSRTVDCSFLSPLRLPRGS